MWHDENPSQELRRIKSVESEYGILWGECHLASNV